MENSSPMLLLLLPLLLLHSTRFLAMDTAAN
jgi:hypothetical protein